MQLRKPRLRFLRSLPEVTQLRGGKARIETFMCVDKSPFPVLHEILNSFKMNIWGCIWKIEKFFVDSCSYCHYHPDEYKPVNVYLLNSLQEWFPGSSDGKESAWNVGDLVWPLGQEDPLEKEMATTHSSILVWKNPWMKGPGGLQSIGL